MDVRGVDPRTATWEIYEPAYRVYFWDANMAAYEYELTGVSDVDEVLRWAEENRGDRSYTAYAVANADGRLGVVRLHGTDPTRRS